MAEYYKEYCEHENVSIPFDFSYSEIANDLSEGQTIFQICEGFGTLGITKLEGVLFLIDRNRKFISLKGQ